MDEQNHEKASWRGLEMLLDDAEAGLGGHLVEHCSKDVAIPGRALIV
jgi:hypothetical protein